MSEQAMILSAKTWNDCANQERGIKSSKMIAAYAALIEQQAARIAELEARPYHYIGRDGKTVTAAALEDRAEAAEAEVKRLREALKFYSSAWRAKSVKSKSGIRSGLEFTPKEELLDDCGNIAREALATQGPRHD